MRGCAWISMWTLREHRAENGAGREREGYWVPRGLFASCDRAYRRARRAGIHPEQARLMVVDVLRAGRATEWGTR